MRIAATAYNRRLQAVGGMHIDQGHLDGQSLSGLNVALACYSPGLMIDGYWQAALYVDERADDT